MFRPLFAFAAAAALVAAGGARSQPTFRTVAAPGPAPLATLVLAGIDDPAVVADLKLSDEQVKALVARRQAGWDEKYAAAPSREADAARVAASDAALKKTLSAEQYRRATQLAAQRVLNAPDGPPTKGAVPPGLRAVRLSPVVAATYPELADALKLTEEQRKTLDLPGAGGAGFGVIVTLSPAQRQAATEFMGAPLARPWVAKTDPRVDAIPRVPRALALLTAKDVRADAGITDEHAKAVGALAERWAKLAADRATAISPKEAAAVAAGLAAETETALAAALTPAQRERLRQIELQTERFAAATRVDQFYTRADSAREFGITPEQVTAIDAAWAAFRADAAKVLLSAEPTDAAAKRLADLTAARRAKAEAVLTADQVAKVKAAFGARFTGSTRPDATRGPGVTIETLRAAGFGRYSTELIRLANDAAVQAELKLTPEQVKQAGASAAELRTKAPAIPVADAAAFAKALADRSAFIEAELGKLLTPAQGKRFREIMMQAREATPARPGALVPSAVSYPGVAEAVGLTADQRKALIDGTAPAEVLTAPQTAALAKLMGEPFAGARAAPRPAPFAPRWRVATAHANPDGPAEADLRLTPEQTKALDAARDAYQSAATPPRAPLGGPFDPAARMKAQADAAAEFEKALAAVLDASQKRRLPELTRQLDAASDLAGALAADAAALDLSDDQKTRLAAVAAEELRRQQLVTTYAADTPDRPLAYRLRDAADERLLAVLTDAQRAKWAELTGPPVRGLRKTIPGGFGFGEFPGPAFAP